MECSTIPARVIATCFALVAFAAAVALGYSVGNPTATIILYAMLAMAICWPVGLVVGSVLQHVNERGIQEYKQRNPMHAETPAPGAAPPAAAAQPKKATAGPVA